MDANDVELISESRVTDGEGYLRTKRIDWISWQSNKR